MYLPKRYYILVICLDMTMKIWFWFRHLSFIRIILLTFQSISLTLIPSSFFRTTYCDFSTEPCLLLNWWTRLSNPDNNHHRKVISIMPIFIIWAGDCVVPSAPGFNMNIITNVSTSRTPTDITNINTIFTNTQTVHPESILHGHTQVPFATRSHTFSYIISAASFSITKTEISLITEIIWDRVQV